MLHGHHFWRVQCPWVYFAFVEGMHSSVVLMSLWRVPIVWRLKAQQQGAGGRGRCAAHPLPRAELRSSWGRAARTARWGYTWTTGSRVS